MTPDVDVDPRVRRFLALRERTYATHWTQRLGETPAREFDRAWRAACALEWMNACRAFDDYCFWTFTYPMVEGPICLFCAETVPLHRSGPHAGSPVKYCSDRCKTAAWRARHPERCRDVQRRYQERQRRRLYAVERVG